MQKINVVTIHGIGVTGLFYARDFKKGIIKEFNSYLKRLLGGKSGFKRHMVCRAIVWDDILAENQKKLRDIFEKALSRRKVNIIKVIISLAAVLSAILLFCLFKRLWVFWFFLIPAGCIISNLIYKARTGFAAESISDIIGYQSDGAKRNINRRILQEANALKEGHRTNITFISHSLGTVIASDFVYDQKKNSQGAFNQNFYLSNFFTMGSPLPLFSLQYGPEMFQSPINTEDDSGRWINIFDKGDPIAYPLKPLNKAYDKAVHKDKEVNTGVFIGAHENYWKNRAVHKIIGRKLAIDWCRLNNKLPEEELEKLYAGYDKDVG
jgi:hypothetical protein